MKYIINKKKVKKNVNLQRENQNQKKWEKKTQNLSKKEGAATEQH